MTNEGLELLKGSRNPKTLYLTGTPVTNDGLEHLKSLWALTYLRLEDTAITDNGLEHLKGLTNLYPEPCESDRQRADAPPNLEQITRFAAGRVFAGHERRAGSAEGADQPHGPPGQRHKRYLDVGMEHLLRRPT